jgi:hypothetical protein
MNRRVAMSWAQRLRRVFHIDIETCEAYGIHHTHRVRPDSFDDSVTDQWSLTLLISLTVSLSRRTRLSGFLHARQRWAWSSRAR